MVRSSFSILFFIRESKARRNGSVTIEAMITVMVKDALSPQVNKWLLKNGIRTNNR